MAIAAISNPLRPARTSAPSTRGRRGAAPVASAGHQARHPPPVSHRRESLAMMLGTAALMAASSSPPAVATAGYEPMEALKGKDYGKSRMRFEDFELTASGLQYKDMRVGEGVAAEAGDAVTVDWDGYTIGYYGRPFEARNKTKGGAFTGDDKDYLRFTLGKNQVIPGFEEATIGMKVGGVRRIIVPVELGYPNNDMRNIQPRPSTFSGKRALGFVIENQGMIDKTLLFDIELLKLAKGQ